MKRWFRRLPIHRKLVVLALVVSGSALVIAMVGLSLFDLWRLRASAVQDADALARVLAENLSAAVAFEDLPATTETLQTVRVRGVVVRACVFLTDGSLLAGYARATAAACPTTRPRETAWGLVTAVAPILRNDQVYGAVYVERDLSDLGGRLLLTMLAGAFMLLVAATTAYALAERVHGAISRPISDLARAVRTFGNDPGATMPRIEAPPDEVGELVASFGEMTAQVRAASEELTRSNAVLRDEIAERRRVEQEREAALVREREASRLKDEFLAAVSHELRTPLNAMLGWAHILGSMPPNEETFQRATASIVKNAKAQARVIEDLIDVSRIVTGKLRLRLEPVDLRPVTASALESIQPAAAAKGIRVQLRLPDEACTVRGDADRLQQMLWNLLSNAVKFTPVDGNVIVTVGRSPGRLSVAVADTGIGIRPDFVAHVFERFRQADGSMTREHGGLGLGLAIVKELAELHGGSVTAASEGPGRGSVFTLTLPEYVPAPAGATDVTGADHAPLPSLTGLRVLAVDDNQDALAIMTAVLESAGGRVATALSPDVALAQWEVQRPDVLICDLAMPRMSGLDLLQRLRQRDGGHARPTPAIAVSAHTSADYRSASLSAGFDEYLAKPFTAEELVRAVGRVAARI